MTLNYKGQTMQMFHQTRVGRLRLYHAAAEDSLASIEDAWKQGTLGKAFLVRPIADQVIGEEVLDGQGRTVAVFGVALTNAFVPNPGAHRKYLEKLTGVVREL